MKKIINKILIAAAAVVAVVMLTRFNMRDTMVTRGEFRAAHEQLRQQIDSILKQCDTLRADVRALRAEADTIKAGNRAIFETMQENQNHSLTDYLLNLFKWKQNNKYTHLYK